MWYSIYKVRKQKTTHTKGTANMKVILRVSPADNGIISLDENQKILNTKNFTPEQTANYQKEFQMFVAELPARNQRRPMTQKVVTI
jgi:hypothetical protein